MLTQNIILAGQLAGAGIAIITLVTLVIRWVVVKPIKTYIDIKTYPISPNANGGKSLPDAIDAINRVEVEMHKINKRVTAIEKRLK